MSLQPPVPLSSLEGGTEEFLAGFYSAQVAATIAQNRLQETLDEIGSPGAWKCDPHAGTLELRGHVFDAEMLGSFGKTEWLWSWANPFLKIPESKTTIAREVREAIPDIPGMETPFVDLEGVGGAHHMAIQVVGYRFAAAYYVCQFPGSDVAYGIRNGQLRARWPKIYELQRAINDVMLQGMPQLWHAIGVGARFLELEPRRTATALEVRDGSDFLIAQLDGDHVTKINADVKL